MFLHMTGECSWLSIEPIHTSWWLQSKLHRGPMCLCLNSDLKMDPNIQAGFVPETKNRDALGPCCKPNVNEV